MSWPFCKLVCDYLLFGEYFRGGSVPFADLRKIEGLNGIYIATQVVNSSRYVSSVSQLTQITLMSFNKGGDWHAIPAPERTRNGSLTCGRTSTSSIPPVSTYEWSLFAILWSACLTYCLLAQMDPCCVWSKDFWIHCTLLFVLSAFQYCSGLNLRLTFFNLLIHQTWFIVFPKYWISIWLL